MSRAAGATIVALLVALAATSCAGPDPGSEAAPPLLDRAAYVRDVQPIFEARCATLDCHGNADRPLRLYAATGLRLAADRDLAITAEELTANLEAASGLDDPPNVDERLVLLKALGRMKHSGDAVWAGPSDPQYMCVRGWLAGASASAEIVAACATAATQVALPPP